MKSGDYRNQQKAAIAERRATVAALYLSRRSQADIAQELSVDQSTVSLDLKALHRQWKEQAFKDTDAVKKRELDRIDVLEQHYWDAWRRSCEEKRSSMAEQRQTGNSQTQATTRRDQILREDRDGNPAFLAGVQWCIERRCKILGLDAPVKTEAEVTGQVTWAAFVLSALQDSEGTSNPTDMEGK